MRYLVVVLGLVLGACGSVNPADTEPWVGQPVAKLDRHPVFLTMKRVSTRTEDGTEIRNYVNAANVGGCSGSGTGMVFSGGDVPMATFSNFQSCMSRVAACNNIFYIKDGQVDQVTLVGSGGARCMTDARFRPTFTGSTNYR